MQFNTPRRPSVSGLSIDDYIFMFEHPRIKVKSNGISDLPKRARYVYLRDVRGDREIMEADGAPTQEDLSEVLDVYPNGQVTVFLGGSKRHLLITFPQFIRGFRVRNLSHDGSFSAFYVLIPEDHEALHRMPVVKQHGKKSYIGHGVGRRCDGYLVPLWVFEKNNVNYLKLLLPDYRERLVCNRFGHNEGIKDSQVLINLKALKTWGLL